MAGDLLIVFARTPIAGRAKTRLGRDIGFVPAALFYRAHVMHMLRSLRDPRWRIEIWLADRGRPAFALPGLSLKTQAEGDLGARLAAALESGTGERVLVIGSDIADLRRAHVAQAFKALTSADAVIGPSDDGGYWAIGLAGPSYRRRRNAERLRSGIAWSSAAARADTLAALEGIAVRQVDMRFDVDDGQDLARLRRGA